MDYDVVMALTFIVLAVILVLAILPRADFEGRASGSTGQSIWVRPRGREVRRRHNR